MKHAHTGRHPFACWVLAVLLLHLGGCASRQTIDISQAMQTGTPSGVEYGSLVRVRLLDRRQERFRVTDMSREGLGSDAEFFRYADMASLEVEQPGRDSSQAWVYVIGVLGVAALVALVANADKVAVCSSPPCPGTGPNP